MSLQYGSERRLDRALQHVSSHWFPIHDEALTAIRRGLELGSFDLDIGFLISELRRDFALFTYCIKELLVVANKERVPFSISSDPAKLIRWAGPEKLKIVLSQDAPIPTTHALHRSEPFLLNRLAETALAATAAESLGQSKKIDQDSIFCHSVVRQIGLNLIAWNYPSLYSRVLRSLSANTSLDDALSQELGFSPALLAMKLLRPALPDSSTDSERIATTWRIYDSLCEIGEALTRANAPDVYPSAERDWSLAQRFIENSLGSDGVSLIRKRAIDNTALYKSYLPELFTKISTFDPEGAIKRFRTGSRGKENPYLKMCPPAIRALLQKIYSEMPAGSVNKLAVEKLVKQVFPLSGFVGGCVFVIDPTSMTLVPRVSFGKIHLRALQSMPLQPDAGRAIGPLVSEVIATHVRSSKDLTLAALSCDHPLIERSGTDSEDAVGAICGVLGRKRRIGVLYLEMPELELDKLNSSTLIVFKALRHTLCDALLVD